MTLAPSFPIVRAAALELLNSDARLTRRAGSFLGQCAVDPAPLSDLQLDWLVTLLDRNNLISLEARDDA